MASKVSYYLLSCIILIFLLVPYESHAHLSESNRETSSTFESFKHLNGYRKGDKVDGLHKLKIYLNSFGYLSFEDYAFNPYDPKADIFDDFLESAIKKYQLNYNLHVTGELDANTVSMMMMPRCGVPDIINGTSQMRSAKFQIHHGLKSFHVVFHYSFFPGSPKWPDSKTNLSYAFLPNTRKDAERPVAQAFRKWSSVSHFKFSHTKLGFEHADLKIGFYSGDHGDGAPFDGTGGVLAHSLAPTDGRLHFDAAETWSMGPVNPTALDLQSVALHEIGHLLGLGHRSVGNAVMFPTIGAGVTKRNLAGDDIQGIKDLYHL